MQRLVTSAKPSVSVDESMLAISVITKIACGKITESSLQTNLCV
jgi:hypothetical protein